MRRIISKVVIEPSADGKSADLSIQGHLAAIIETFVATEPHVRAELLRVIRAMDLRKGLADVDLPTVVLSGTRDRITPPRLSRLIVEALPQARLVALPGAGHMLPWEEADRVAATIADAAAAVPALRAQVS